MNTYMIHTVAQKTVQMFGHFSLNTIFSDTT
jgi:hypothetical protein